MSPDLAQSLEPLCAVFRRHLKSVGQKYTPERAQILDTLVRLDDLFEAEALQRALKRDGYAISKATVYRTIKLLQDAGIIQKIVFDSDLAHYQLSYGRRPRELLVRLDTNQVVSIEVPELAAVRDRICQQHGVVPTSHRFVIFATGGQN
jgi:Fur family transcriptional regulator, ferric uptake regulator